MTRTSDDTLDAFDAFESAGWEQAADAYEDFFGPITDRLIAPILDATGVTDSTRLLDVGCGPGHCVAAAAARGARPVGIDIAHAMVDRARDAHPDLEFHQGDAQRLPFPGATFDVVTANFAILHLGHPEQAVSEFARVLSLDGRVAITIWDQPEHARLFGWVLDACAAAGAEPVTDIPSGPPFFRFAAGDELATLLKSNGFEDPVVHTLTFTHRAPSTNAIWTGILDGSVRTAALVREQTAPVQKAIRHAFDEIVTSATVGTQIEIPFSVKLATASLGQ
ncbi:MAG: class I SAM-dependent methyltransferase [Acidimicrobiales bacterium]